MELFPSDYQQMGLSKNEKLFVRYANSSDDDFGFLLLKINPAMIKNEYLHTVITEEGITFVKVIDISKADLLGQFISAYHEGIYKTTYNTIINKLKDNTLLLDNKGRLKVRTTYLCVFPEIEKAEIDASKLSPYDTEFYETCCLFKEDFIELKKDFSSKIFLSLKKRNKDNVKWMQLNDGNINSVLQRIAPEYTIIRFATIEKGDDNTIKNGVDDKQLIITKDDVAVRAFRLDTDQVNIVNKMTTGDQLILACAGSGKSVLLISKCFKAARMNPDKKFLITCYNRNLQSQYVWFIENAGLQERNVECKTFDALCRSLLERSGIPIPISNGDLIQKIRERTLKAMIDNQLKEKYYGVFIDEVQMFEPLWYKLCFNLLENKNSEDHIFVLCGDKTQEIKKRQKHGRAPWNAGAGYPTYRGNKNIRIEKNFRNSIVINEYINRFAGNAKKLVQEHIMNEEYDPDFFLRGRAFREGGEVSIKIQIGNALAEADEVGESIHYFHEEIGIPYDEIAIAMYNRQFKPMRYYIESAIVKMLEKDYIPYNRLYTNDQNWGGRYGAGGVSLITFDSTLGLDFRAVIVCGIKPLGAYDRTKNIRSNLVLDEEKAEDLKKNISYLYVACTRARDYLHVILSEEKGKSVYNTLLVDSE